MTELEADPEWVAARDVGEREIEEAEAASREQQAPLLTDLGAAGVDVADVWDLVNSSMPYPNAVPVLVRHLHRDYEESILEGIARALAVPAAAPFWGEIMPLFRAADPVDVRIYRGLAAALGGMATKSLLPEVRQVLRDRSLGPGRVFFLRALTRLRAPDRWDLITELVEDPQIGYGARDLLHQRELRGAAKRRKAGKP